MIKHKLFLRHSTLVDHLPETRWHTATNAMEMLRRYAAVYIKPDGASGGTGIIKVRRRQSGYEIIKGFRRKHANSVTLYKALKSFERSSKKYIVQRGIKLARINGSIFDVRMYLQKTAVKWNISGMVARVAARNMQVTNAHQGGYAKTLNKSLLSVFKSDKGKVTKCIKILRKISLIMAAVVERRFPDTNELGIDLGVDQDGRVWIIEANTRPKHQLFTQLRDKSMLYTIRKNKRLIRMRKGAGA